MKKLILPVIFLAVFSRPPSADAGSAGSARFDFLSFDTSARAAALGGAYTALAANSGALHYNPAGLAAAGHQEASFMHNQYFQGITQEYLGYASANGWGADFNYLSFGGIRETTLSNHTGAGLGEVGLQDMAFGFGYGRKLRDGLLAGAGLKLVRESIAGNSASGFMLDAGLLWDVPGAKGLNLGLAMQNLGPSVNDEPLPFGIRAGAGYKLTVRGMKTTLALDLQQNRGEDFGVRLGCAVLLGGAVPLRVGYNTLTDDGSGISAGLGYTSGHITFDYAYAPFKDLGAAHRFSITYRLGKIAASRPSRREP